MKSNALTTFLNWLLAASLILSIIFFVQYFFRTREARRLQTQVQTELMSYQNRMALLNLLGNDLSEYSKRNKDIVPLLESLRSSAQSNAAPAVPSNPVKRP